METATRIHKTIEVLPADTLSKSKNVPESVNGVDQLLWRKNVPENLIDLVNPKNFVGVHVVDGTKYKARKAKRIYSKAKKTSDYIDYASALLKGRELLWNDKQMIIGFYIIFSINTGLRVSDVLSIKHSDLKELKPGDYLMITEKKTKKVRKIQINDKILDAYKCMPGKLQARGTYKLDGFIFTSQKGSVFATISLNRILKEVFAGYCRNISTHSLRKSFGRRVYDSHQQSEHSLIVLSEMFNHTSMAITRRYLGIRQQEIDNIYLNL